jgi:hypothetical protein
MDKKGGSRTKTLKKKSLNKNRIFALTKKRIFKNLIKKKNANNIEKAYRKVLNVFKKYFKSILRNEPQGDEKFGEFVVEIENKLNDNILNEIKVHHEEVYNVLDKSTINSDGTIELYVNLINNLDEKEHQNGINVELRTNITRVQTMIADDLIERFTQKQKVNNMVLENGNNGLNGLTSMIKRLNVKEDSSMDDLMSAMKGLGF